MKFIEPNPLAAKPKGRREPYDELVGKLLGPEAQAAASQLTGRRETPVVIEDELPAPAASKMTDEERLILEGTRLEREADGYFRQAVEAIPKSEELSSDKQEAIRAVTKRLAEAASFNQAKSYLSAFEDPNDQYQAWRELASAFNNAGRTKDAELAAMQIEEEYRDEVMREIKLPFKARPFEALKAATTLEDFNKVIEFASNIERPQPRANLFMEIGRQLANSGLDPSVAFAKYREAAFQIEEVHRGHTLRTLVLVLIQHRQFAEAKAVIPHIEIALRNGILFALAKGLATDGQNPNKVLREAEELAPETDKPYVRAVVFSEYASALAKSGQDSTKALKESEQAMRKITNVSQFSGVRSKLCLALAQAQRFEEAIQIMSEASVAGVDGHLRASLFEFTDLLATAKDFEQTTRLLSKLPFPIRGVAFMCLTVSLSKISHFEEAKMALTEVPDPDDQDVARKTLATELTRANRLNEAEEIVSQLETNDRWEVLTNIAEYLADSGQLKESFRLASEAEKIRGSGPAALIHLARVCIESGEFELAKLACSKVKNEFKRLEVLLGLATAVAEAGQDPLPVVNEARSVVEETVDDRYRPEILSMTAAMLVKVGKILKEKASRI